MTTEPTTNEGPPCGHLFGAWRRCAAAESHSIHHGEWRGPEETHDYVPWERRAGRDRREAEARDATGLLEWQHAIAGCRCPERPNCLPHASDGVHQWLDLCDLPHDHTDSPADRTVAAFQQRDRAALATAPPEPRWPSRDELDALVKAVRHQVGYWSKWPSSQVPMSGVATALDRYDAALREGGERP